MANIISLQARPTVPQRMRPAPPEGRAQILFFTGVRYERPTTMRRQRPRKAKRLVNAETTA